MKIFRKFSASSLQRLNHVPKFYKEVVVQQRDPERSEFFVMLDHRKLKTPDGHQFYLPNEYLADIVAKEF